MLGSAQGSLAALPGDMLFNLNAIGQYVDWAGSLEDLCDLLTELGLEVEEVNRPDPSLHDLLVGEVREKDPHPDADRLSLCGVSVGESVPRQIVCGATNHEIGSKVVVVSPGQTLPDGLKIEEREIRGVKSSGMMCSERELGLGDDHEGIILLPDDAQAGEPAFPYLVTIDLSITPNRPDCLGWVGIAREIAAHTGGELRIPESPFESDGAESISIQLDDPVGCPRYLGRIVRGVKVAPSPQWLMDALRQVGMEPINNVVDVTNFVLMERGQPLHAFDLSKLKGPEIRVRRAKENEPFQALDGETYHLGPDHLVIADSENAVALAGVMGGVNTSVTEATVDLLIECAYFNPSQIRKSSRTVGLSTDSSYRFERGVDAHGLESVIDRCTGLILEVAGGRATSPIIEAASEEHLPKRRNLHLRPARTSEKVGTPIAGSEQRDFLERLGCGVVEEGSDSLNVEVPTFRPDLEREIDLIEEIARHYGFDNIPSQPPSLPTQVGTVHPAHLLETVVQSYLVARGWTEAKTFSFSRPGFADRLGLRQGGTLRDCVTINNPISSETAHLRTTLIPNLLEALQWNIKRGEHSLRLFEFGKVYLGDVEDLLQCERHAVALVWMGPSEKHWSGPDHSHDFFDGRGEGEALLAELGVPEAVLLPYECEYLHPGQSGRWTVNGNTLGIVGRLHPETTKAFDLPVDPILVEMDMEAVYASIRPLDLQVEPPSPYPPIRRDLSLTVGQTTSAIEVATLIRGRDTDFLEQVHLFDRYLGEQVGEGNQSLGFRLTYRSREKTLTEEEITPIHHALLQDLSEQLGAVQRGME